MNGEYNFSLLYLQKIKYRTVNSEYVRLDIKLINVNRYLYYVLYKLLMYFEFKFAGHYRVTIAYKKKMFLLEYQRKVYL